MKLRIKRSNDDTKGLEVFVDDDTYLSVICTGITLDDHKEITEELNRALNGNLKSDIYFSRNLASIFIADTATLSITTEDIKELIPDYYHVTVYKGAVYGSRLSDVSVTFSKGELRVGKKFSTLLTLRKD
jgi:hypothetical protein